ncbi:TPA: hypothetical protein N0F65_011393 [Lagenidium giganteum]|uniref:Uncharacterized protein n=1 Tax=Lagenidium giganteum TaxID=4803 RepID=A0AAV2Z7K0_9STRA|nr:TPA: hypothetical protein N0F65_011393 [Lagenidium giganteum]
MTRAPPSSGIFPPRAVITEVQDIIIERFSARFTGLDFNILWVSLLDPRLTYLKHLSASERMTAHSDLFAAAVAMANEAQSIVNDDEDCLNADAKKGEVVPDSIDFGDRAGSASTTPTGSNIDGQN